MSGKPQAPANPSTTKGIANPELWTHTPNNVSAGLALSEVAYQNAAAYARDRLQGRALSGAKFKDMINTRQESWRRIATLGIANGIGLPAFSGSLAYYEAQIEANGKRSELKVDPNGNVVTDKKKK